MSCIRGDVLIPSLPALNYRPTWMQNGVIAEATTRLVLTCVSSGAAVPDSGVAVVFNRRQAMVGAGTMVLGAFCGVTSLIVGPGVNADETLPTFAIPKGATDSHVHVFSPVRFPYSVARSYTPGEANLEDLEELRARLGISRLVLVQPSVYGTDNRCVIDTLHRLGSKVARAIAVIDAVSVTDAQLHELRRVGVVGVRVNLNVKGEPDVDATVSVISQTLARVTAFDFNVQMYIPLPMIDALADAITAASVPVVLDHFAGAQAQLGLDQPGFTTLRRLLSSGKVWVKLSAPYRASQQGPDFPDLTPIARALIETNADRLVWGSDWPHTGGNARRSDQKAADVEPFQKVDDSRTLGLLSSWAGDRNVHRKILVDNAERLYRF
jgi:predicted TIM-barrel fold metal-dependent hydrolase